VPEKNCNFPTREPLADLMGVDGSDERQRGLSACRPNPVF
jgi:hypothetical protein